MPSGELAVGGYPATTDPHPVREDNETVCKIVAAGGSAKLAHMPRTHRVNAASVAEWCGKRGHVIMEHARTDDQAADIGTKRFTDALKWLQLLYLNGLVSPLFFTLGKPADRKNPV